MIDINECEEDLDSCDNNARCIDTIGSYDCECYDGYEGDGFNCSSMSQWLCVMYGCVTAYLPETIIHHVDIDECDRGIDECSINAQCLDTMGSYNCTCNIGYDGNGFNCTSKLPTYTMHFNKLLITL